MISKGYSNIHQSNIVVMLHGLIYSSSTNIMSPTLWTSPEQHTLSSNPYYEFLQFKLLVWGDPLVNLASVPLQHIFKLKSCCLLLLTSTWRQPNFNLISSIPSTNHSYFNSKFFESYLCSSTLDKLQSHIHFSTLVAKSLNPILSKFHTIFQIMDATFATYCCT